MNTTATQSPPVAIYRAPNAPEPRTIGRLPARTIARHHQPGADYAVVHRLGFNELHITIQPRPGDTPGNRRISVSGTASIALGGASVHKGEIDAQVDLTMDVIEAILVSRGLDFSDVNRATAFVKLPRHAGCLDDWFERQDLWFPAVTTHTDVCRDELLFEIELDAIMEKPPGRVS